MASNLNNLSEYHLEEMPDLSNAKIGIIVSEWNAEITALLYNGCREILQNWGLKKKNLLKIEVPGSYELPGRQRFYLNQKNLMSSYASAVLFREKPDILNSSVMQQPRGLWN